MSWRFCPFWPILAPNRCETLLFASTGYLKLSVCDLGYQSATITRTIQGCAWVFTRLAGMLQSKYSEVCDSCKGEIFFRSYRENTCRSETCSKTLRFFFLTSRRIV